MMTIAGQNSNIRGYVTLGNPGVGKSRFLSYCLWRFGRDGKRVFFESVQQGAVWLFDTNGQVSKRIRGPEFPFETSATDFYLFDPYGDQPDEPLDSSALTIIAASPNPFHYKGFRKRPGCKVRFFMPVWTEHELELFRSATHSLTAAELHDRFQTFGGIPRYVFTEKVEYLHAKAELDVAITEGSSDSLHVLRAALGNMESGNKISHKLIHYKVETDTYQTAVVRYASDYVERELPLRAPVNRLKDLGRVLSDVADADVVMEGHIFELYLHRMIPLGVTMEARCLQQTSTKHPVEISFARREVEVFRSTEEMMGALKRRCYCRPNDTNYTAIDAVSWLGDRVVFLQYTRSVKHDISMDQLTFYDDLVAAKKINNNRKIYVFFIVPSREYETFKMQAIYVPPRMGQMKTKNDKPNPYYVADIDKKVAFVNSNIEQWVAMLKTD